MTLEIMQSDLTDKKQNDFKDKVDILLHSEAHAKRLIGVMSLYGRLYYDWTLANDVIEWRGPIQLLLGSKFSITTGDMFLRKLTMDDFNLRISELSRCFKARKSFKIDYHLHLGDGFYCIVQENAELLFTQEGKPAKILGCIKILPQALSIKPKAKTTKDKETDLMCDKELEKILSSSIVKAQRENTYGAYMTFSIDKLTNIIAHSGESGVKKVIKFVSDTLRTNIRTEDAMGRLSGNTFGLVLYNCDRWGIITTSERLLGKVQEAQLKIGDKTMLLTISCGGAVFPCDTLAASEIMSEADIALLDAQNTKGIARFWAPSIIKGGAERPPERKQVSKSKRRIIDA